jgi:PAS domain S-box-containing protein
VLAINLSVIAVAGIAIYQSRLQYEERARIITQNCAQVLDEYINGVLTKIDVTLLSVGEEAEKQLKSGGIKKESFNAYIKRQYEHIPEFSALRMADAKGDILYGVYVPPGVNIRDREYWYRPRYNPKKEMFIPRPVFGRISKAFVINISRRVNNPDGSFAGVVFGTLSLDNLTKKLSGINLGKQAAFVVLNKDRYVVARYPEPKGIGDITGKQVGSPEFVKLFQEGKNAATYKARSSVDGVERLYSYRKIADYPLYINVGLSKDDYLSEWRKETAKILVLVALLSLVVLCLAYLLHRYIIERERAAEHVRVSEESYRTLFENANDAIIINDMTGKILKANQVACDRLGYTREELMRMTPLEFVSPEFAALFSQRVQQLMVHKQMVFETCHARKNGTLVPTETSARLIQHEGQQAILAIARDITERKKADEALRESEEKLKKIIDGSSAVIFAKDLYGKFLFVNSVFEKLFHISRSEIVGKTDHDIFPKEIADAIREADIRALKADKPIEVEETVPHDEGVHYYISLKFPLYDKNGVPYAICGMATDITERRLERERLQTNEMRLRESQEVAKIGSWTLDVVNNNLEWSDETYRRFDKDPYTFPTSVEYFLGRIYPDDRKLVEKARQDALEKNKPYHVQARIINETGREWIMEELGRVERDSDGDPFVVLRINPA